MAKTRLQPRERMVLILGGFAVVGMALWWVADGPYQAYLASGLELKMARQRLTDAQILQAEVERAREKEDKLLETIQNPKGGTDLWTEIDRAVKDLKLGSRCSMRSPRGVAGRGENLVAVELSLTSVSTQELVDLLHRIYDIPFVVVLDRLDHLKPAVDKKGMDCRMQLVSPRA